MPTHITARLAWHNDGWNGTVCRAPEQNTYCVGWKSFPGDVIARERDLAIEKGCVNGVGKQDAVACCARPGCSAGVMLARSPGDRNRSTCSGVLTSSPYPSSMAERTFRRQIPKVGTRCVKHARRDLCGGCSAMALYRDSRNFTSGGSHLKPEVTVRHTTSRTPFGGCAGLGSLLDFSDHPAIPQIASDCVRRLKISLRSDCLHVLLPDSDPDSPRYRLWTVVLQLWNRRQLGAIIV